MYCCSLDRRREALAVARSRSEWLRARRLGPAPKRQARCAAAHEETPEIRRHTAARDDHGQAPFVQRCKGENGPSRGTSPAQGPEQSSGELPPTNATTRADHEAIQISPAGATVSSVHDQVANLFHVPYPEIRHRRLPPRFARASVCDLAQRLQDRFLLTRGTSNRSR